MKGIKNNMDIKKYREDIDKIDKEMAELFEKRMAASKEIAKYKNENNLPIFDMSREEEVLNRNSGYLKDKNLTSYYLNFQKALMNESKKYQSEVINSLDKNNKTITINLLDKSYEIIIKNNAFKEIDKILPLKGKTLLITDSGVPREYYEAFLDMFPEAGLFCFHDGEDNKTFDPYMGVLEKLKEEEFSRNDNIVALGGGLVSDVAGFIASTYMRGMNFYIIPTTLLADVDASIGGKVAVNFEDIKNLVGNFYQPKKVIIDPKLLNTLSDRLFFEGLVESIKMAATYDKDLFEFIEKLNSRKEVEDNIEEIIYRSLLIKKAVVEEDEKELHLRKILNFGHTVGHALELLSDGGLYHGEAVGIGMTYFSSLKVKNRIISFLKKFNLPYQDDFKVEDIMEKLKNDKKRNNDKVTICYVNEIGKYELRQMSFKEIEENIRSIKHEK